MNSESDKIIQELEKYVEKYGTSILNEFEDSYPCSSIIKNVKVPFIAKTNSEKMNSNYEVSAPCVDYYYCRIESYEKFWHDWSFFKRVLKLRAFS